MGYKRGGGPGNRSTNFAKALKSEWQVSIFAKGFKISDSLLPHIPPQTILQTRSCCWIQLSIIKLSYWVFLAKSLCFIFTNFQWKKCLSKNVYCAFPFSWAAICRMQTYVCEAVRYDESEYKKHPIQYNSEKCFLRTPGATLESIILTTVILSYLHWWTRVCDRASKRKAVQTSSEHCTTDENKANEAHNVHRQRRT